MLCLRVKAAFAAFRTFTAGSYRPTAPFITPSAAYGLVLNLAGIESRFDDNRTPMTLTRTGLPRVQIALGSVPSPSGSASFPEVQNIYQQLHNYPVGATGQEHADACKGAKYNIQPVRREFLSGLDAYICLRGNAEFEKHVKEGLRNGGQWAPGGHFRYGLPFLGDNSFMIDILKEESSPGLAHWYSRSIRDVSDMNERQCRLTVWIDRNDIAQTRAVLYAPLKDAVAEIPELAWTLIDPPAETQVQIKESRTKGKK
jgi:CRISPR-associated protein Cas5t